MWRGESSCIVPISESAVHQNPDGSRQAILHFQEYLEACPNDLGVRMVRAEEKIRAGLRAELTQFERWILLQIFDSAWKDHLHSMDQLKEFGRARRGWLR